MCVFEDGYSQYRKDTGNGPGKLVFEANDGDQQIRNHRCPHLPKHRIDAPSHEFIHLKISLQRLEEKFHLPPCFVQITDGFGRQIPSICEEYIPVSGSRISKGNAAQFVWVILSPFYRGESNILISHH